MLNQPHVTTNRDINDAGAAADERQLFPQRDGMYSRARELLNLQRPFGEMPVAIAHLTYGENGFICPTQEQHILRMMVKSPTSPFLVPEELAWLQYPLDLSFEQQRLAEIPVKFVYVTVRHGLVKSVTDDAWHVDGFSMRVPHTPEQNYAWSSNHPTQFLNQRIHIPDDFDPLRHNIHTYFQDAADDTNLVEGSAGMLFGFDPYVIHRRPSVPPGTFRTFFRISFVPIEIEDDTCAINPLMGRSQPYGRRDIREMLIPYPGKGRDSL